MSPLQIYSTWSQNHRLLMFHIWNVCYKQNFPKHKSLATLVYFDGMFSSINLRTACSPWREPQIHMWEVVLYTVKQDLPAQPYIHFLVFLFVPQDFCVFETLWSFSAYELKITPFFSGSLITHLLNLLTNSVTRSMKTVFFCRPLHHGLYIHLEMDGNKRQMSHLYEGNVAL